MTQPTYLVVGVPCSGKSWVCGQQDSYDYIAHDDHIGGDYTAAIIEHAKTATRPLLVETPFSVSQIVGPLANQGFEVTQVFIIEDEQVLTTRYAEREEKPIPQGHISRQKTYAQRAMQTGSYVGTSTEVADHLRRLAAHRLASRLNRLSKIQKG